MRLFKHMIAGLALACSVLASTPLMAAAVVITAPGLAFVPNTYWMGSVTGDFSTPYTNSTTTPSALTGMSVVIPATKRSFGLQYVCARWSVDATKATSTTGSVTLAVNGAADANSTRYTASSAGRNTISGAYCVLRTSAAAQTVALNGVSADTAALTVNAAYLEVWIYQVQSVSGTSGL